MSDEPGGLLATAAAAPETTASAPAPIDHKPAPQADNALAVAPATTVPDGSAWVGQLSTNLYKEGKPNYEILPQKFWEGAHPRLDKALGAYTELEKKFARGDHKAPDAYDTGVLKQAGVPDDDPLTGAVAAWAREQGISQDAFNKLASSYIQIATDQQQRAAVNIEVEKQRLGPNADKVIESMVGWAQGLVAKGIWGPDDFDEFKVMGGTAQGLRALQKVREFYGDIARIPIAPQEAEGRPSKEELQAMVGDPRYAKDPAYRAKVERLFEQAYG
jgi:hypothetical protein